MRHTIAALILLLLASVSLSACGFGFGMTGEVVRGVPNVVLGNNRY